MNIEFRKLVEREKKKRLDACVLALKEATPVDTGEARDGWRHEGDKIVNDVEHISYLNEGSSQQAPAFFVERTLLAQPGVTPGGSIVRSK